jgi:D-glycero-D-manno-heptose 1,7-bisphosphate phosphatase
MDKVYKLIGLDADGTMVTTKSGSTFRENAADWKWLPGRFEKIRELLTQGKQVVVITNQGGVAYGFMKQEDILVELVRMCLEVGIRPTRLYVCYTHPKGKIEQYRMEDDRRKPGPGMLKEAMQDCKVSKRETLYVGDLPDDEKAAKHAGCDFMWAEDFFASTCRQCGKNDLPLNQQSGLCVRCVIDNETASQADGVDEK